MTVDIAKGMCASYRATEHIYFIKVVGLYRRKCHSDGYGAKEWKGVRQEADEPTRR